MKTIEKGKPITNKKVLELRDIKSDTVKVTITLDRELHRKIKYYALDHEKGFLELVLEAIKERFDK